LQSALPVLFVAVFCKALLVGQNKGYTLSWPASEATIEMMTNETDASDLLKSTESETQTEQFTSESTKLVSRSQSTDTEFAGLELRQRDRTISGERELIIDTPKSGLNLSRESSQGTTTGTSNGLETTQQNSTARGGSPLVTIAPESVSNLSTAFRQDATARTPNELEFTQQVSSSNTETKLFSTTPETGSGTTSDFSQKSTELVQTTNETSTTDSVASETYSQSTRTPSGVFSVTATTQLSPFPLLPPTWKPYTPVYQCLRSGRFPARSSCTEYNECRRVVSWLVHFRGRCPHGRKFSSRYGFCVPSRLSECRLGSISSDDGNSSSGSQDSDNDDSDGNNSHSNEYKSKRNRLKHFLKKKRNRYSRI
jgi:hypothetical protein